MSLTDDQAGGRPVPLIQVARWCLTLFFIFGGLRLVRHAVLPCSRVARAVVRSRDTGYGFHAAALDGSPHLAPGVSRRLGRLLGAANAPRRIAEQDHAGEVVRESRASSVRTAWKTASTIRRRGYFSLRP